VPSHNVSVNAEVATRRLGHLQSVPENKERQLAQQEATPSDSTRRAAEQAFAEGEHLYAQGTPEGRRQAIAKYEAALRLWQSLGDRFSQGTTLTRIGIAYNALGEYQKALEYYTQALPLYRAVGDRAGEADALNSIGGLYSLLGESQKALDYLNQALPLWQATGDRNGEARTLNTIGATYNNLGEKQKAVEFYNQALPLWKATGNRTEEGLTLGNLGLAYDSLGEKQKALDSYNQALILYQAVGNQEKQATILMSIGSVYSDLVENQKALEYYNQALQLVRALKDQKGEASILLGIGKVYRVSGEKQKALDYYKQALQIFQAQKDRNGEARTLNNIALVYSDLGENRKALNSLNQVLMLFQAPGERYERAVTLNNIALVYSNLSENQKALGYYEQVLSLFRDLQDRHKEAFVLNNIANIYQDLGENQKALDYHNQALPIRRAIGDRPGEAITLNNISNIYRDWGDYQEALDFLNQALPIHRSVGDRDSEAKTLDNIGSIYDILGENQRAIDYHNQAQQLFRAVGNRQAEALAFNNIGLTYNNLGENQKALEYYKQALLLSRAVEDPYGEAIVLNNMANIYDNLGENQNALDVYNQTLLIKRTIGDRLGEAIVLNNIGNIYGNRGEYQKALDFFNPALSLHRTVGNQEKEAGTLLNIARVEQSRGNLNTALTQIEAAIKIIENLRTNVASSDLRASYFATVQEYYGFYIDLLMALHKQQPNVGHDIAALEVSESARARSLLELLNEARVDIRRGVDPVLRDKERQLLQQIAAKTQYQQRLLSSQPTEEQKEAVRQEIDQLQIQLQNIEAQIRRKNPDYARVTQPGLTLSHEKIQQQVVDKDTILLSYWLGEEHSYLWAVTPTNITSYELPGRAKIEEAVETFLLYLDPSKRRLQSKKAAAAEAALSQMLLEPVAQQLGQKCLLIVGDGVLQYLPFSTLPIPQPPMAQSETSPVANAKLLLEEHEIVNLPSASTLETIRNNQSAGRLAPKKIAVLADPVFGLDDPRVKKNQKSQLTNQNSEPKTNSQSTTSNVSVRELILTRSAREAGFKFERLSGTRQEAEKILALVPEAPEKMLALDFNASRSTATNGQLSQYRIVHFATHGFYNKLNPELSGIVFSLVNEQGEEQNGLLLTPDIFNLNLPAELVVLSACRTVEGKDVRGEGIVGLTRGLMYAGASRVVVSLWKVDDGATAEFMTRFYREILENKLPPAEALRSTQLSMQKDPKWQDPNYWAAFILQGEWR